MNEIILIIFDRIVAAIVAWLLDKAADWILDRVGWAAT